MDQAIQIGSEQGLFWTCHITPANARQEKGLGWGKLTLQVRGQPLWGCAPSASRQVTTPWPLVDFLSGLARIWPWLCLEEGYPIDINPEHIGHMMRSAEQRWEDLSPSQAEMEEDILFDFRQRHDLSLLFRGLNVHPLWNNPSPPPTTKSWRALPSQQPCTRVPPRLGSVGRIAGSRPLWNRSPIGTVWLNPPKEHRTFPGSESV
ncbi:hypothetical protein [Candidatus Symbiobacter mobilis]|uniref:Uncharacterized protein n=1 Tax=Candidatus Symbiobacter mobilis CR TaxID=946483 RepID=U5N8P1_9BURK|nr:hypothetical protein [Candidatus Symbiobacter mobilis]AGX86633.1 hypothetical protein Cenrod_0519 [Candidatus Symbiobacter mobilis CR]